MEGRRRRGRRIVFRRKAMEGKGLWAPRCGSLVQKVRTDFRGEA